VQCRNRKSDVISRSVGNQSNVQDPIGSAKSQEKIFKVALPVSLEAVFQTSLGFVDQIIVGTLGGTAVAAVGLSL
jgi:Na+-driven multidrug efflux pump